MKRNTYLHAIAAFACLAALASCDRQNSRKVFHLTGFQDLEIPCQGGSALFGIEANEDDSWSLRADGDWFTVIQTFGEGDGSSGKDDAVFLVKADRWIMNSTRTGTVTVTGPSGTATTKNIIQKPKPLPERVLELEAELPSEGGEVSVELPEGYWVSASTEASWLTVVSCEEGLVTVNAEPDSDESGTRSTVVTVRLSDGTPLARVTVNQSARRTQSVPPVIR